MADSAAGSVAGQKRGVAVEQPAGLLASLIGDTSVTQRWLVSTRDLQAMSPLLVSIIENNLKYVISWVHIEQGLG